MPTAKELLDYQQRLRDAVEKESSDIYYNDSILHATMIMKELFHKALKEDRKTVRMFCGNFSLFRDHTASKIENEKNSCSLEGLTDEERQTWAGIDFFGDLKRAFVDFVQHADARFELIMQYGEDSLRKDSIWEVLRRESDKGKAKVYVSTVNLGLDHFATTATAYRVENSDVVKTATCCFNDKNGADVLNDNFIELTKFSSPVIAM